MLTIITILLMCVRAKSNCHPEATSFLSPKDLGEPRDSPAFSAGE
jgi:hypothetical protein